MINKRMLKFAFCGTALAAFAFAGYAAGEEVTLQNGTPISWDDFVKAVNDPTTIKGNVADVPATNDYYKAKQVAQTAYDNAVTAQDKADNAVTDAQAEKNKADGDVTAAQTGVTTAQTNVTAANNAVTKALNDITAQITIAQEAVNEKNNAITAKDNSIEDKRDEISLKQSAITTQQKEVDDYNDEIKAFETQFNTATGNISDYNSQLTALNYELVTVRTPENWFKPIYDGGIAFYNYWEAYYDANGASGGNLGTIFYSYTTGMRNTLTITFGTKPDGYTETNVEGFYRFLMGGTDGETEIPSKVNKIKTLRLYLGDKYKEASSVSGGQNYYAFDVTVYDQGKEENIISLVKTALESLASDTKYRNITFTSSSERDYGSNQSEANDLINKIALARNSKNEADAKLNGGSYYTVVDGKVTEIKITVETKDALNTLLQAEKTTLAGLQSELEELDGEVSDMRTELSTLKKELIPLQATLTKAQAVKTVAEATTSDSEDLTSTSADVTKYGFDEDQIQLINTVIAKRKGVVTAQAAVVTAQNNVTIAQQAASDAQSKLNAANTNAANAENIVNSAKSSLNTAQTDLEHEANRLAQQNYYNIQLNSPVIASTPISNFSGTIKGNGNVINVTGSALITNLSNSELSNVGINGVTYTNATGTNQYKDVARWNPANNSGRFYDEEGNPSANFTSIGELGFEARDFFGANMITEVLTKLESDTKVYHITAYEPTATPDYYMNLKEGDFVNKIFENGYRSTEGSDGNTFVNMFISSESSDKEVANMTNIITNGNKCNNVVIVDGQQFFAPFEINATKLSINREFKAGYNTVCLPFALSADMNENIDAVCKYDTETAEKFWFTKVEETIPANEPVLLHATEAFSFSDLENVAISATPNTQLTKGGSSEEGPSFSHGTFKRTGRSEFLGDSKADRVYGLNNSGVFQVAGASATFPAFRMVLSSGNTFNKAPRRVAIRDERGIEITEDFTTGVETVNASELAFDIKGGNGEIIFTADNNYGEVAVYDMNGRMVTMVNVLEGTTTANVAKGFYIVNGKKVMVK